MRHKPIQHTCSLLVHSMVLVCAMSYDGMDLGWEGKGSGLSITSVSFAMSLSNMSVPRSLSLREREPVPPCASGIFCYRVNRFFHQL
jgi:hypothetical protein